MYDCVCECVCDCVCNCLCDCRSDGVLENIPLKVCKLDCWKEEFNVKCFNNTIKRKGNKVKNEGILKISKLNIKYDKLNGRPSIEFYIKDRNVQCLLDTGARVNVIEANIVQRMKNVKIRESTRRLTCANDSELINYGTILVKVIIEGRQRMVEFYVVKGLDPEMIAGVDLLDKFGIKLTKEVTNNNQVFMIRESPSSEERLKRIKKLYSNKMDDQLMSLITEFNSIFMADKWDIGKTILTKHKIDTHGEPVLVKPYRQPKHFEEKLDEVIKNFEENDIIEKCNSPWNFPLVCVWKKDKQEIRVCVDFRQLNKITVRPAFPMPNVEDMLNILNGAKCFSTIDLGNAYYQVELEDESKIKTAFSTKNGQYCFKRMPFGIAAAPATFQELMVKVLGDLNWKEAVVYLDDILIFAKDKKEHLQRVKNVFQKIKESGLKINPEKCQFLVEKTKFLGYVISKDGIETDKTKIDAINKFQNPSCIKHLRSFLGLTNYYRKFIKDYARYSKVLEGLCGKNKDKKIMWTPECDEAFQKLKDKMVKTPILAYPDFNKDFILDTDASFDTIGAVLSQKDEYGRERVIAYGSHKMNKHELGYCITRKELLAIYYFTQHFKHFLYGKRFLLRTDHKAITFMMTTKNPITPQFQTWINFLSSLDMKMEFRKGEKHSNADAMSRNSSELCSQCQTMHEEAKKGKIKTRILAIDEESNEFKWQKDNEEIKRIMEDIRKGITKKWKLKDDIVATIDNKYWIPKTKRIAFIEDMHKMLCHAGSKKVYNYLKDDFDMENMREIIKEIVQSCENCQRRKTLTTKTKERHIKQFADEPFQKIYMDFCGPFKRNVNGYQYILAIIDQFSRYISLNAVAHQDEKTVRKILLDRWIWKFGPPKEIHVDKGKTFESALFKETLKKFKVELFYSSPYHHNTNGVVERQFRTIRDAINIRMKDGMHRDWTEAIPEIEFMLNSTIQATTGVSPAEIIFGRKLRHWWKNNKESNKNQMEDHTRISETRRKFEIGERVLIKKENVTKEEDRYMGPATIKKRRHERSYELQFDDGRILIRNVEWLKPFKSRGM
jgi:transposase InsO family protein